MKNKKYLKHLLTALTIILGINIWVGTKGEIGPKAASLTQPTPINQIFLDSKLVEHIQSELNKTAVIDPVSQDKLNMISYFMIADKGIESIEGA